MKFNPWGALLLCVVAWFATGCFTPDPPHGPREPCSFDELNVGDVVTITFTDMPTPVWPEQKVRVKDDGTLSLPLNKTVVAAGKKIAAVEKEIRELYVPDYYRQMTVLLKTEERFYTVGGEVRTPNRFVYWGETTVLRAIQSAGYFTDFANRHKVTIHRANGQVEVVDCAKAIKNPKYDVPICPGDSVIVPRRML